jgi:spermidine synthase
MKLIAKWRLRKPSDDAETVYVSEQFGVRSLHIGSDTVQSAMRLARPYDLELSYTRSMMALLLLHERPRAVLMIGLGGGSLAKFFYHRLPHARVHVVEINPRVVAIARQCFHVPPDDDRLSVTVGDGAEHVAASRERADAVIVDGYDGESHVEALATRAFYGHCRERLAAGGVLVVNLWGGDREFHDTLKRIEAAFPEATLCLPAEKPGNVVVFGFRDAPGALRWDDLRRRALALEQRYGLEFPRFVAGLRRMNRCDDTHLHCG